MAAEAETKSRFSPERVAAYRQVSVMPKVEQVLLELEYVHKTQAGHYDMLVDTLNE
jgi:hypothetical protein